MNLLKDLRTNWKYIFILTLFIVIGILSYYYWYLPKQVEEKILEEYGLWQRNFNELVAGYVVLQKVKGLSELFGYIDQTNVYLEIIDYMDEEFIKSLEKKIEEGNTINIKSDGNILFNLGCLENNKIIADSRGPDYMNKETQETILKSTKENPVSIVLYFEQELGKGCKCCSFAKKVWLY